MKKLILLLVIFIGCSLSLVKAQTELHSNEQNSSADSILIIKQALANKYTINSEGYFIFGDTIENTIVQDKIIKIELLLNSLVYCYKKLFLI